jgi:hypothetical protein
MPGSIAISAADRVERTARSDRADAAQHFPAAWRPAALPPRLVRKINSQERRTCRSQAVADSKEPNREPTQGLRG